MIGLGLLGGWSLIRLGRWGLRFYLVDVYSWKSRATRKRYWEDIGNARSGVGVESQDGDALSPASIYKIELD